MDFVKLWHLIDLAGKLANNPATTNLLGAVNAEILLMEQALIEAKAKPAPTKETEALGQFGAPVAPGQSSTQTSGSAK